MPISPKWLRVPYNSSFSIGNLRHDVYTHYACITINTMRYGILAISVLSSATLNGGREKVIG